MTRYTLKDTDRAGYLGVYDNEESALVEVLPTAEAGARARELNYSERGKKSRTNRWNKPPRPENFNARVIELREAGLSFLAIADLLGVSVQVVHRVYHLETKRREAEAWLELNGMHDKTPIDRLAHRLPEKVYESLQALNVGLGKRGTVGYVRRAPDALLLELPGIGRRNLEAIRDILGVDCETKHLTIAAFAKLVIECGGNAFQCCS